MSERAGVDDGRLSIAISGDPAASGLAGHVAGAFRAALSLDAILPETATDRRCGRKFGAFLNALVRRLPDARLLQVDAAETSVSLAATWDNRGCFVSIRDRADPAARSALIAASPSAVLEFRDEDVRAIDWRDIEPFSIYCHGRSRDPADRMHGLVAVLPALDRPFVAVVGDWNAASVRDAQRRAVQATNMALLYAIAIRTSRDAELRDEDETTDRDRHPDWANGYHVGVYAQPPIAAGT